MRQLNTLFSFVLAAFALFEANDARAAESVPYKSTVSTAVIYKNSLDNTQVEAKREKVTTVTEYFMDLSLDSEIGKNVQNFAASLVPEGKILKCDQYAIRYDQKNQKENRSVDGSSKVAACLIDVKKIKKTTLICYNTSKNSHAIEIYQNELSENPMLLSNEDIDSFLGKSCPTGN